MKKTFAKYIVFCLTVILSLAYTVLAFAGSDKWKKAEGNYTWTQSSQFNNGTLYVRLLEEDLVLFDFKTMRGSEAENSAFDFNTAGIFLAEDNKGEAEFEVNKKIVTLNFVLDGKKIKVTQKGEMPANLSGVYEFTEKGYDGSEAAATAIIEGIAPAKTSLTAANRPYNLVYANDSIGGWFYNVMAIHTPTKKTFARFLVAADMSAVYRVEGKNKPQLIYGSAKNMLKAQYAPLLEKTDAMDVNIEGKDESKNTNPNSVEDQSTLSAVVSVGPKDYDIKVGTKSQLVVSIPGNLKYKLTDLKSSSSDKVSVDANGNLEAKAEGDAFISGKLVVDDASADFSVAVNAYVPKLECNYLPTHLDIGEKIPLEAYIVGVEGTPETKWSVSDSKIAVIEKGFLVAKADGIVEITGQSGELQNTWKVAVGKSKLPNEGDAAPEDDDDDFLLGLVLLGLPLVLVAGGIWWWFRGRKKA